MVDLNLFNEFLKEDCNRKQFILDYLSINNVKAVVMPVEQKEHIYVVFPKTNYDPYFKIKTVLIHYDRVKNSPGANDNSVAVFLAMNWAIKLNNYIGIHNIRLIFTDGEEASCDGVVSQGAYSLGKLFNKLGINNEYVFVFDCVGRGNIPVFSDCKISQKVNNKFIKNYSRLKNITFDLLKNSCSNCINTIVPYSDNGGFIANGIPAIAITFLPQNEIDEFLFNLVKYPQLENYVLNNSIEKKEEYEKLIPLTWKLLHTPNDNINSLTKENWILVEKIFFNLANLKIVDLD